MFFISIHPLSPLSQGLGVGYRVVVVGVGPRAVTAELADEDVRRGGLGNSPA